jgi:NADH-quinone oxidoreductase subunit J
MFILSILKNPEILFSFITFLMLICSILVITNKNPIHSILFLVLIFIITTVLFLILNVDFLAMLFLVLYVGAIVVLFLFVVMMLNVRILELRERVISYLPIAVIIAIVFLLLIVSILRVNFITPSSTYNQEQNNDIFQYFYNLLSINTEHLPFINQAQL